MPTSAKRTPAKSANNEVASLKRQLRKTQQERDTAMWLHAELAFKVRSVIVQQMLNNPKAREQLERKLIEQMGNGASDPLARLGGK